jgi:hypothetical protein
MGSTVDTSRDLAMTQTAWPHRHEILPYEQDAKDRLSTLPNELWYHMQDVFDTQSYQSMVVTLVQCNKTLHSKLTPSLYKSICIVCPSTFPGRKYPQMLFNAFANATASGHYMTTLVTSLTFTCDARTVMRALAGTVRPFQLGWPIEDGRSIQLPNLTRIQTARNRNCLDLAADMELSLDDVRWIASLLCYGRLSHVKVTCAVVTDGKDGNLTIIETSYGPPV